MGFVLSWKIIPLDRIANAQVFDPNIGRVLQIRAGASDSVQNQSYGWDTIGNLTSRADTFQGYTETFTYDALNRLLTSQIGTSTAKTITYDASGNITKKSDICGTANCFTYGSGAGPHALTALQAPTTASPIPPSPTMRTAT